MSAHAMLHFKCVLSLRHTLKVKNSNDLQGLLQDASHSSRAQKKEEMSREPRFVLPANFHYLFSAVFALLSVSSRPFQSHKALLKQKIKGV